MGKKKGKSKQPPPLKTTANCRKAVAAYEAGDYNKSLKLIRDCQSNYRNCAFYHHAEAFLLYKIAKQNEDSEAVLKNLLEAATMALQASKLLTNSIVLAHFCASVLYDLAALNKDYEGVIKECYRALDIENPMDADRDNFIVKDFSQEKEVEEMKQDLREMIKKCERKKSWVGYDSEKRLNESIKAIEERVREAGIRVSSLRNSPDIKLESFFGRSRLKERKKKSTSEISKEQKARSFWNSKMSIEDKLNLFKVRIEDLKAHLGSLKDCMVMDLLLEAIEFVKRWKTWKFWECCDCCEKFVDCQAYMEHLYDSHDWKICLDVVPYLPPLIDDESIEIIVKGDWKPVNTWEAIKKMHNQFKSESCSTDESVLCAEKGLDEHKVTISEEDMVKHLLFGSRSENVSCLASRDDLQWPLCDDSKRAVLLGRVHSMLQLLLGYNYLTQNHVYCMIEYTIDELKINKISDSWLRSRGLKTLKLVCLLGSPQLERILYMLQCVPDSFGLSENSKIGNSMDEQLSGDQAFEVVLSEDFSCFLLDDRFLRGQLNLSNYFGTVAYNGSAGTSKNGVHGNGLLPGSDDLLSWLFADQEVREALDLWTSLRKSQNRQVMGFFQIFKEEHFHLVRMCDKRRKHFKQFNAVKAVDNIYAEEIKRREQDPERGVQTVASLLRERLEELNKKNDNSVTDDQFELDFILNVLEIDQAVTAHKFGNKSTMQENSTLSDYCLQKEIKGWKMQLLNDLQVDKALIMQSTGIMKQYGQQLGQVSAYDYRLIMLPILNSFIKSRLEDLMHKDALEKSNAAMKFFLAELDVKKNINKGCDDMRQTHRKSIDTKTKKNKRRKEAKDLKNCLLKGVPVDSTAFDHPVVKIGVCKIADGLKQQEEKIVDKRYVYQMQSFEPIHGFNTTGAGLKNEAGENNCFLNVIIQSLWHLRTFAKKFMSRSKLDHKHVKAACIVCALHDVFYALCRASASDEETVSPTPLRMALNCLYKKRKCFLMGQMNDASYVFEAILSNLHQSFTSSGGSPGSPGSAWGSNCNNSSNPCLVHNIFGMNIEIKSNGNHSPSLVHRRNISEFIYICKNKLTKWKVIHGNHTFEKLVKLELEAITKREIQSTIGPNAGDGGKLNHANVTDWHPPHVLTIVLEDENDTESKQEISATYSDLLTELDIGVHSQGSDPGKKFILISMVCYHESKRHYSCFIYNHEHQRCFSYDDKYVKDIGNWDSVFKKCIQSHMEPYILIFETTNLEDLFDKDTAEKSEAKIEAPSEEHAVDTKKTINEVCDNARKKEDQKKKKNSFRKAKESKATGDSDNFQLHQKYAEQDNNPCSEIGDEEKLLEEYSEHQRQNMNEPKQKSFVEKNADMIGSIGENVEEVVYAIHSNHHEDDNEKRLEADIRKAVRLSLNSFENQHGALPTNVKDGTTPQLDVYRYVIIQSQWRLRQLRDEFMSKSQTHHTHNGGDLCFLCAYNSSFAALRVAFGNETREAFGLTPLIPSKELPIAYFIKEWLNKQDQFDKDAKVVEVPESASELENQLVAAVRNIMEELEQERQQERG